MGENFLGLMLNIRLIQKYINSQQSQAFLKSDQKELNRHYHLRHPNVQQVQRRRCSTLADPSKLN